MTKKALSFL